MLVVALSCLKKMINIYVRVVVSYRGKIKQQPMFFISRLIFFKFLNEIFNVYFFKFYFFNIKIFNVIFYSGFSYIIKDFLLQIISLIALYFFQTTSTCVVLENLLQISHSCVSTAFPNHSYFYIKANNKMTHPYPSKRETVNI